MVLCRADGRTELDAPDRGRITGEVRLVDLGERPGGAVRARVETVPRRFDVGRVRGAVVRLVAGTPADGRDHRAAGLVRADAAGCADDDVRDHVCEVAALDGR